MRTGFYVHLLGFGIFFFSVYVCGVCAHVYVCSRVWMHVEEEG